MNPDLTSGFRSALEAALLEYGIPPLADEKLRRLSLHYALMIDWNRRVNLTRITEPGEAARFHYAESLFGARFIGQAKALLDIGSGAGFPAVPLAVMRDDVSVTALEANQRKALFLREAKSRLDLSNFAVVAGRVEDFDWSGFDLLTCRALDRGEKLLPPLVEQLREGQRLMVFCGPDLAAKLRSPGLFETHQIPMSQNRTICVLGSPRLGTASQLLSQKRESQSSETVKMTTRPLNGMPDLP